MSARPPFKWAGGKRALAGDILERFPPIFRTYREPFLGAGAVFVAMHGTHAVDDALAAGEAFPRVEKTHAILSDANANLVCTWRAIRDDVEGLAVALTHPRYANDGASYLAVRDRNMNVGGPLDRAADFLYLNRFGFNGLYRVNRSGRFNVPFGDNPRASIDVENLRAVSALLQGVDVRCEDFAIACLAAVPGDVVYLDPPYVPLTKTSSFSAYEPGGFGFVDHERLRDVFAGLVARGVHAYLSNSDTPLVHELSARWRIVELSARRAINAKASARGAITELLVLPEAA